MSDWDELRRGRCAAERKVREDIERMRQRVAEGEPPAASDNRLGLDAAMWLLGAFDQERAIIAKLKARQKVGREVLEAVLNLAADLAMGEGTRLDDLPQAAAVRAARKWLEGE